MRVLFILGALVAAFVLPAPASAHTPTQPCSISVDPGRGGRTDVYRITGRHFPLDQKGGSLEVQIDIFRVAFDDNGERLDLKRIYFVSLIPGIHRFYVDYNDQNDGKTRLQAGHYVVAAESAHQAGCRTVSGFDIGRRSALAD